MAGPDESTADPQIQPPPAARIEDARETRAHPLSEAFPDLETADTTRPDTRSAGARQVGRNIDAMLNVDLRVQIILGHARMPISELLKLSRGSVIELDRKIGEAVDVVINDRLVARGDLIKLDGDKIGVSLTEIVKDYVLDS